MNSCSLVLQYIAGINWWWFAAATIVVFGIGAVWYSFLFAKKWAQVFKFEKTDISTLSIVGAMLLQLATSMLLGLVMFILTGISVWIAVLALVSFCGWEKGNLNFEFSNMNDFLWAATIKVGHLFISGIVFILFALI